MWYDVNKTLSYNCLLNFVVGQRGVGKTYSCKRRAINSFLKKGEQFVYLRRYDTELKASMIENFFDDIMMEFPDHSFLVKQGKFYIDEHIAGFYIPLSKSAQYKSIPFPNVSMIIFDEFIIDQGLVRYLPNEVITFNEMYSTIARLRDVVVLFLSNAITFTNPYFLFFDLKLQQGQKVVRKGDILLELVENKDYSITASKTRFGQIIKDTDYGKYAIENQFLKDDNTFIEKLPDSSTYMYTLSIDDRHFGVHSLVSSELWYISEQVDPTCKRKLAVNLTAHNTDTVLIKDKQNGEWFEITKQKFFAGQLRFTTMTAKNLLTQVLRRY